MISVIVLTKNEEASLPGCLESLAWCDDVHVLDSGSTDNTTAIAQTYGAKVWVNRFEGFGKQRNFALDHIDIKNEWILFLDADEYSTEKFKAEIFKAVELASKEVAGFYCCGKLILEGKWLKRSDTYPIWQFRLLRRGRARFSNIGHGQKECNIEGQIGYIHEGYLHFSISKGWMEWIERHQGYAKKEAEFRHYNCPPFRNIFVRHSSMRNVALKCWLTKLLIWPFLRFTHAYFLRLGFLEGIPGLLYCTNKFYYEFMISLLYREHKMKQKLVSRSACQPDYSLKKGRKLQESHSNQSCTPN